MVHLENDGEIPERSVGTMNGGRLLGRQSRRKTRQQPGLHVAVSVAEDRLPALDHEHLVGELKVPAAVLPEITQRHQLIS